MTKIPVISKAIQRKHAGRTVAIVDGRIIAHGKDTVEAAHNAEQQGFDLEEIMIAFIAGDKRYYAV